MSQLLWSYIHTYIHTYIHIHTPANFWISSITVQFFFQCALFQYPFLNPKPCTPCLSPTLKHNPLNTKPPTVKKKNASCTKETKTPVLHLFCIWYISQTTRNCMYVYMLLCIWCISQTTRNCVMCVCVYDGMYMIYITNNMDYIYVCKYISNINIYMRIHTYTLVCLYTHVHTCLCLSRTRILTCAYTHTVQVPMLIQMPGNSSDIFFSFFLS